MTSDGHATQAEPTPLREPTRADLAITVDYEVRDFIGSHRVSVEREILRPTSRLMSLCDRFGAKLTLMFEMAEYLLLCRDAPALAREIEAQLKDAVHRGHDVQLHLHPHLLPQSGAVFHTGSKRLRFRRYRSIHEFLVGDPHLLARCKRQCEDLLRPVDPNYEMVVFRAGKYHVQPHQPVYDALARCGFIAASNVVAGRRLEGGKDLPTYDYRGVWTENLPYYPSPEHMWWPADVRAAGILELPIYSRGGTAWSFDALDGPALIRMFEDYRATPTVLVMIGHSKGAVGPKEKALEHFLAHVTGQCGVQVERLVDVVHRWRRVYRSREETAWQKCVREYRWPKPAANRRGGDSRGGLFRAVQQAANEIIERQKSCRIGVLDCGSGQTLLAPLSFDNQANGRVSIIAGDRQSPVQEIVKENCRRAKLANVTIGDLPEASLDLVAVANLPAGLSEWQETLRRATAALKPGGLLIAGVSRRGAAGQISKALNSDRLDISARSRLAGVAMGLLVRAFKRRASRPNELPSPGFRLDQARQADALDGGPTHARLLPEVLRRLGCALIDLRRGSPGSLLSWKRWFGDRNMLIVARREFATATDSKQSHYGTEAA